MFKTDFDKFVLWSKSWRWYCIREYSEVRRQVREGMFMTVPSRFVPYFVINYTTRVLGWAVILFLHTGITFFWVGFLDIVTKVIPDYHFFLMVSATVVWVVIYFFEVPGLWYLPAIQSLVISFLDSSNVHDSALLLWYLLACIYGFIVYDFFRKVDTDLYILNAFEKKYVHTTRINAFLAFFFQVLVGLLTLVSVLVLGFMYFIDSQVIGQEVFGPILGVLLIGYIVFLPSYLMLFHAIILYKKWSFFYFIKHFVLFSILCVVMIFHCLIVLDNSFFFVDFNTLYSNYHLDLENLSQYLLINDLDLFEDGSINPNLNDYFTDKEKPYIESSVHDHFLKSLTRSIYFVTYDGYYYYLTDKPWLYPLAWLIK
jgi:hypothetical protein